MNNNTTQDTNKNLAIISSVSELAAAFLTVDEASEGQRIDNFLTKTLKGVPKATYIVFCVVVKSV